MRRSVLAVAAALSVLGACGGGPATVAAPSLSPAAAPAQVAPPPAGSGIVLPAVIGSRPATLDQLATAEVPPPVAIRIDSLGVDAAVIPVGVVAATEQLDVPPQADLVAWYRHGAAPGRPGSAVLAGHVDFDGRRGVFFRLGALAPGDVVSVTDAAGATIAFEVVERMTVAKGALDTDELFRRGGPASLALITCGGEFDRAKRSYADNVVVVARPLS